MSGTLLDRKRREFTRAVHFGDDFLGALDRDGFTLTSIRDLSECSWLVQAKAPEQIQQRFSTAPELLFVVSGRELFRDYYPTAYELFVDLSIEDDTEGVWAIHGRAAREAVVRFGLMRAGCDAPELIRFFRWYTREIHAVGCAQAV